jgi:hypothetical protein
MSFASELTVLSLSNISTSQLGRLVSQQLEIRVINNWAIDRLINRVKALNDQECQTIKFTLGLMAYIRWLLITLIVT